LVSPADTTPIAGLPQQAQSGLIVVADGVGRDCAGQCAHIIDMLRAVQDNISNLNNVTGFGGKPSGDALQSIYDNAANSLGPAVDDHIAVLTDLGQTFVWAQQHYDRTDGDAAADFRKLIAGYHDDTAAYMGNGVYTNLGVGGGGSENGPSYVADPGQNNGLPNMKWPSARAFTDPVIGAVSNYDPADNENNGVQFDYGDAARVEAANRAKPGARSGVNVENTSAMAPPTRWDWYGELNLQINKAIPAAVSANWLSLAGRLGTALSNFTNSLQQTQNASPPVWSGQGIAAAASAVNSYAAGLMQLVADMRAVGESLQNAAGWLDLMQKNTQLPLGGYNDSDDARTRLATADDAWLNWYAPEVESSAYSVPVFSSPLRQANPLGGGDFDGKGGPLAPDPAAAGNTTAGSDVAAGPDTSGSPESSNAAAAPSHVAAPPEAGTLPDSGAPAQAPAPPPVHDPAPAAGIGHVPPPGLPQWQQGVQQVVEQGAQSVQQAVTQGVAAAQAAAEHAAQALQDAPRAVQEALDNARHYAEALPPIAEPRHE
jgi:hypothetical protein